ncbi:hypothetical protein IV203_025658 [Nitzschia inconspicua]|uniref:Right handed beta helix domain-containing protein n=1 Tax=Nitzschia inconspicua TaxID=303405 RepID=A0A9K3PW61_9STRA|nr:hypothetical protein IV203_025658 [Nitzschia inconspicua]
MIEIPSRSNSTVSFLSVPASSPNGSFSMDGCSSPQSPVKFNPPRIITTKRFFSRSSSLRKPRGIVEVRTFCFALLNFLVIVNSWRQLKSSFGVPDRDDFQNLQQERSLQTLVFEGDSGVQFKDTTARKNSSDVSDTVFRTSMKKSSLKKPSKSNPDQEGRFIVAGLADSLTSIPNSTLAQLVQLNCEHQVSLHILTAQISSSNALESLQDQYTSCAPFIVFRQNKAVKSLFPNRIDRIAYLRDVQRDSLYRHFVDGSTNGAKDTSSLMLDHSVIMVVDLDLKGIPTNEELIQEATKMARDPDTADVICASGQMMNPIGYYDIFATILAPQTFTYPIAGRLVEKFQPGEDTSLVRSNDIYGSFTQLDLLDYFEQEALNSVDGTVPVRSCFGGLTLYRGSTFFQPQCKYSADVKSLAAFANKDDARPCEHVVFHDCLLKNDLSTYIAVKPSLKTYWDEALPPKSGLISNSQQPLNNRLVTYRKRPNEGTQIVDGDFSLFINEFGSVIVSKSTLNGTSPDILWRVDPDPKLFHEDWDIMFFHLKPDGLLVLEQQVKKLRSDVNPRLCHVIDEYKGQHACRIQLWSSEVSGHASNEYSLSLTTSGDLEVKDIATGTLLWSNNEDTDVQVHLASDSSTSFGTESPRRGIFSCIDSGDETVINAALDRPGAVAALCPGSIFRLKGPIIFSHDHQKLYTQDADTNETITKALIIVDDPSVATAVSMVDKSFVELKHVVVDGNRKGLGHVSPQFYGGALIDAGGSGSVGQVISYIKAYDPRSWACVHIIEGPPEQRCQGAIVENNDIGPCGSHSSVHNEIADGISYACTSGIIRNNVVEDATDGGIVVFGAPNTVVEGNTIRAVTRTMLGGINMVDTAPYDGNYAGTIVRNNVIDAKDARIHVGLGMGSQIWQCPLPTEPPRPPLYGGVVVNNTLTGNHMGYGFAINGVKDWTVFENKDLSSHVGEPSLGCNGQMQSPPKGFQFDPVSSHGSFQSEFETASLNSIVETFRIEELDGKKKPAMESWSGRFLPPVVSSKSVRVEDQVELVRTK